MTPKEVTALIISALEDQAKTHLPAWAQDEWINRLGDLLEKGLYHAIIAVIENLQLVQLEADEIEIIDQRKS